MNHGPTVAELCTEARSHATDASHKANATDHTQLQASLGRGLILGLTAIAAAIDRLADVTEAHR